MTQVSVATHGAINTFEIDDEEAGKLRRSLDRGLLDQDKTFAFPARRQESLHFTVWVRSSKIAWIGVAD